MKGFTLIELLAVIVILAVILVISVPQINKVIEDSKLKSFESDAKIVLNQLDTVSVDNTIDITTINETNIETILGIKNDNYDEVIVNKEDDVVSVSIIGKNKWDGLAVYGTYDNITSTTLPDGLIGEWNLNVNANDSSGNNNNGTVTGAVLTTDNHGKSNSAYSFDGVNDAIVVPYTPVLAPTSQISFGIWVYRDDWSITFGEQRTVISKTETGGYTCNFDWSGGIGYLSCLIHINGLYSFTRVLYTSFSSGWHFIMNTYDGRYIKLYVDGELANTYDAGANYPIQYSNNNIFVIGAEAGGSTAVAGNHFPGKLDNASVYNRALTSDEVKLLYDIKK